MIPAITTEQMREVDRAMIEDFGIELIQMMENAGRALALLARKRLGGSATGRRVLVLAGKGNNGGGGLVAARRLATWGADLTVILTDAPESFKGVPAHQLKILQAMELPIHVAPLDALPPTDIVLDALIGYGLRGAPREPYATLIRQTNASGVPIVALDTPSGLDTTSGQALDPAIRADATLTLALPKTGLFTDRARAVVGELFLADISVPPLLYQRMGLRVGLLFDEHDVIRVDTERA
ncbi:MAG: NAD(P)H-hydrate epimerase [Anaerolineae bacterium]